MMRYRSRLPSRQAWVISGSQRRWPGISYSLGSHNTSQALVPRLMWQNQSSGGAQAFMFEAFDNRVCKKSSGEIPPRPTIHDLDPHAGWAQPKIPYKFSRPNTSMVQPSGLLPKPKLAPWQVLGLQVRPQAFFFIRLLWEEVERQGGDEEVARSWGGCEEEVGSGEDAR